ncbi:MAG: MmgE/PrpD family protein [Trebonia sp.]
MESISTEMAALSAYVAGARERELPAEVQERAALHTLDTLAAIISGSEMPAGVAGRRWAKGVYGTADSGPATIIGGGNAATVAATLCNGMSAHADETDDSHLETHSHPGCGIVPSAVAAAQDVNASGLDLLRAVAAGYDVGCRVGRAVGLARKDMAVGHRSSHALVSAFGAAAAAAVLYGLDEDRMHRPDIVDLISKTELRPDSSIAGTREAEVTVYRDGAAGPVIHNRHIGHVRGTPALPMSVAEVRAKAVDLVAGVKGQAAAGAFCDAVIALGQQPSVRDLVSQINE